MATTTKQFDSVSALGRYLADPKFLKRKQWETSSNSAPPDSRADFFGGLSLCGAVDVATGGGFDPNNIVTLQTVEIDANVLTADLPADTWNPSMAGPIANVPAFLAGVPDAMFDMDQEPRPVPFLKIGVAIGRSGRMDPPPILARGAAILSIVDALAMLGIRVELDALWRNQEGKTWADFQTRLKHADQQWDPNACAFALCHPAFNRRLMWRVAEAEKALASITRNGYGSGVKAKYPDYDIAIPYMTDDFETIEEWIAHLMPDVKKALAKLS